MVVSGRETLSETLGLWMSYALDKNDQELFDKIHEQLHELFLENDGFVHWKLTEDGESEISTNALIDDLRIAEVLLDAYNRWDAEEYLETADLINEYLSSHNVNHGILTDYYDQEENDASSDITLSYIDIQAMNKIAEEEQLNGQVVEETMRVLTEAPLDNGFYPSSYNVVTETYTFDDEINIVDQAIIAYHYARVGQPSVAFLSFIQEEMDNRGLVRGIYDRETRDPIVQYESPAIYGFLILYLLEINEIELAKEIFERMKAFQVTEESNDYYGGYSIQNGDTHIFDNLLPLMAEQQLEQRD
ncbi:transcriptional regulator [Salicibibacter cibi]|uniref:Transcriptional regulator n=1 Tax=Salicibibacter cibi TaxID=2743001 RepID=A0A7T7CGS9_9BACI|nr:glycosyl hydrolase family 8 [Salicibibacter cibi]QQK81439.1 transcriptional regulator [Salicibibacter cibi]